MISIIIPTLNEERSLRETLAQFKKLTTIPFEIIVSDGGSQDKTLEIAQEFDCKIVIYNGKKRQTIGQARNLGAEQASGDFFVFIDADIRIPKPNQFFREVLQAFKEDRALTGATVHLRVEHQKETFSDRVLFILVNWVHGVRNNVLQFGSASGEFQCVRAEAFRKIGGFNESLVAYEDIDLFERLANQGKTRLLPKQQVFHSGRRAHKIGHIKLVCIWLANAIWFNLFRKSLSKEWTPIR